MTRSRRSTRQGYESGGWPPYVPVAERRRQAAAKVADLKKAGQETSPVEITGRKITTTFWGKAWCDNLEAYSDYANRMPRGRTYVRNGSVIDLQIATGEVRAVVSGREIYQIVVKLKTLPGPRWKGIKTRCAGQIGSLVELLQGSLSSGVMEVVTRPGEGLFPSPREITLSCSCPDWAVMCKHVAATLYGVGARLDGDPGALFTLRGVDPTQMVEAAVDHSIAERRSDQAQVLETDDLSSIFGVEIDPGEAAGKQPSRPRKVAGLKKRKVRKKKVQKKKPATPRKARKEPVLTWVVDTTKPLGKKRKG